MSDHSGDKTFPTMGEHMVHIVQSWDSSNLDPKNPANNVTVQVYSDAPAVELFLNGASVGPSSPFCLLLVLGSWVGARRPFHRSLFLTASRMVLP